MIFLAHSFAFQYMGNIYGLNLSIISFGNVIRKWLCVIRFDRHGVVTTNSFGSLMVNKRSRLSVSLMGIQLDEYPTWICMVTLTFTFSCLSFWLIQIFKNNNNLICSITSVKSDIEFFYTERNIVSLISTYMRINHNLV